jgi:hypothetical protein
MQIDAQLVRDLFACCRKMQQELHFINGQCLAISTFDDKKEMRDRCVGNIAGMTNYIYNGATGFPDVAKTLAAARVELEGQGEWRAFSDYIGFKQEGGEG